MDRKCAHALLGIALLVSVPARAAAQASASFTPSQIPSATPTPVFQFAGASTTDFSVRNAAGVALSPDWCDVPNAAISLSLSATLAFSGSTAAVPTGGADVSTIVWFKCLRQAANQNGNRTIFYHGADSSISRGHFATKVWKGTSLAFSSGGNDCGTTAAVCDGSWHHVAMALTSASATVALYLDGALLGPCVLDTPLAVPASPSVLIGWDGQPQFFTNGTSTGEVWAGSIADARIFDYALSAAAVAQDARLCATASGTPTPSSTPSPSPSQSESSSQSTSPSTTATPLSCSTLLATSCDAGDIGVVGPLVSAGACCAACGSFTGCSAWTWFGSGDLSCHLKASCGGATAAAGYVSGAVLPSWSPTQATTASASGTPTVTPTYSWSQWSTSSQAPTPSVSASVTLTVTLTGTQSGSVAAPSASSTESRPARSLASNSPPALSTPSSSQSASKTIAVAVAGGGAGSDSTSSSGSAASLSAGAIAGIALACLAFVAIAVCAAIICLVLRQSPEDGDDPEDVVPRGVGPPTPGADIARASWPSAAYAAKQEDGAALAFVDNPMGRPSVRTPRTPRGAADLPSASPVVVGVAAATTPARVAGSSRSLRFQASPMPPGSASGGPY